MEKVVRGPMVHHLKCWPDPFDAVGDGRKLHEVRKFDRDYRVGDVLVLDKYEPEEARYLGFYLVREVSYFTPGGKWDLPDDVCVMSIAPPGSTASRLWPEINRIRAAAGL